MFLRVLSRSNMSGGRYKWVGLFLWLWFVQQSDAQVYGLDSREPIGAFLNNKLPAVAGPTGAWTVSIAFPNLTFEDAVSMIAEPGTNRLYVCGHQGIIWFLTNNPAANSKTVFLGLGLFGLRAMSLVAC